MPPATLAPPTALIGGALWILESVVGRGTDALGQTLHWGGLALLLLACAVGASGLVNGNVAALRLVVTLAFPLLAWSVVEFFRPEDTGWYDGAWGALAVAAAVWGLWRGRGAPARESRPSPGAHAR
jgi:hypothetical protein